MTLPRNPAEASRYISEKLNWFEKLFDAATGFDERQDLTNRLLMEILKISGGAQPAPPPFFPPALSDALMYHLTKDRPEFYKFVEIDLSTARTNVLYEEVGTFIQVDNQFARGEVTLKLNEDYFDTFDLRRQRYIRGPFYRFYVTNVAGQGSIRLFISRGFQAASEPIEAINRAELAARLGSPATFDRRGDVIWLDSFGNGLAAWKLTLYGDGASIAVSSSRARNGAFSCLLTAGDNGYHAAQILHYLPHPVLSALGFEFSFTYSDPFDYLWLDCWIYTISGDWGAILRLDPAASTLSYVGEDGGYYDIATDITLLTQDYLFNTLKMVVDLETATLKRVMLNHRSFRLDGIPLFPLGIHEGPHVRLEIYLEGRSKSNDTCYIDDVIITQNEP